VNPPVADQGKAVATVMADDVAHAAHEVYEALLTAGPSSPTSVPPGVLAEPMAGVAAGDTFRLMGRPAIVTWFALRKLAAHRQFGGLYITRTLEFRRGPRRCRPRPRVR
jgi:hypothetical protein